MPKLALDRSPILVHSHVVALSLLMAAGCRGGGDVEPKMNYESYHPRLNWTEDGFSGGS